MAYSTRRASHESSANINTNSGNCRTSSIDNGVNSSTITSSRRLSMDNSVGSYVQATVIAQGPPVAFYGSCAIGDIFYIHGGIRIRGDRAPSNRMFMFHRNTWTEITTDESPALSYHRCVVMGNGQYIVTIGGWDGSKRKSDVHVYDVVNGTWYQAPVPGFPSGGGLNNHAVIPMKSNDAAVLVIGRDGSLRTQRKHGDAYCLRGDPAKRNFRWEQYPIAVDSRSGHSLIGHGSSLYIIGGRADHLIQQYTGLPVENQNICNSLYSDLKQMMKSNEISPMKKLPSTRKDHASLPCGSDLAIVYGGETFDGKLREPSNEIFVVTLGAHGQWYNLGQIEFGRQGHTMVCLGDRIIVHGGLGKTGVCGETFLIDLIR
ncbi:unnamed protein product [Rotaria socialis]|uniref:Uncharacterized protein n=4 Tax=Rotaria socialis TaxID=392032 RepID=A0A818PFX7_9BILA|nr:unnamed protein product [Rotaria socialis]CAF3432522.1 unnamed protein product [Rotaria socialis]CAF3620654.1 unnamed protein product [Rotaria socialis]CAF4191139.1 unnamed protein product [Rotaria socialis]CAF4285195.1 unnamed protein product [Rotaria socialis]